VKDSPQREAQRRSRDWFAVLTPARGGLRLGLQKLQADALVHDRLTDVGTGTPSEVAVGYGRSNRNRQITAERYRMSD